MQRDCAALRIYNNYFLTLYGHRANLLNNKPRELSQRFFVIG